MAHYLPPKMQPYTGSFQLHPNQYEESLLECMPNAADTAAITKEKLSKLCTIVYILIDNTNCSMVDGPAEFGPTENTD